MLDELRDNPEVLWGTLVAFGIVVLLTPAVGGMARLLGVVDAPEGRRLNKRPIPRLGGLAIFLGILVPSLAFLDLSGQMRGILLGAAVACVVGAVDDFRGLSPLPKLGGQVLAAAIPTAFGVWIDHFTFPFVGIVDLPAWVGIPLTIVWIVAVMNMVNFLDGMDGLAAGVCAITGLTFAILALSLGRVDPAILSAVVAGACVGFLRHNFFPARIFMGDSGALTLGFVLAAVSVQGLFKTASTVVLFLPLLVLAVPILDSSFVVARRLKHGENPFAPDQAHLHFRFLQARLLAAAGSADHVGLDGHTGRCGARHALHPLPGGRRVASVGDARRRRDRARRAGLLGLRRLPARDRQAREPARTGAAGRGTASGRRGARCPQDGLTAGDPLRNGGSLHELRVPLVEVRMALRVVAVAGEDEPLRIEASHEHVADRVESVVMCAGDDELRERRRGERVERDLRLPEAALDHQGAGALHQFERERRGWVERRPDVVEESAQKGLRIVPRPVRPPVGALVREPVRGRMTARDLRRGRLEHRERAHAPLAAAPPRGARSPPP